MNPLNGTPVRFYAMRGSRLLATESVFVRALHNVTHDRRLPRGKYEVSKATTAHELFDLLVKEGFIREEK